MSLVSCARVGDALTDWLDTASQLKKDALCEALACGHTDEEIAAVFMNCAGVAHIPGESIPSCDEMDAAITAAISSIFVGGTDGQVWTKFADGTQGWADAEVNAATADSTSVALTGDGSATGPVTAEVILNPSATNRITATATGLLAEPELPGAGTAGQVLVIDPAGEPAWSAPEEATINTQDSASVTLTGDGTTANPLQAVVAISTTANNRITADATGLHVAPELPAGGATGQVLTSDASGDAVWATPASGGLASVATSDSATVSLTGDGTAADPIEAEVGLDTTAGNRIAATATGLRVEAELPAGGTVGQVLTTNAAGDAVWETPASGGLASVATSDSATVSLSGSGTTADPIEAEVELDTTTGNRLTATATGLRVEAELPASAAADAGKHLVVDATGTPVWQEDAPCFVQTVAGTGNLVEADNGKLVLGSGGTKTAPNALPIGFRVDLVGPVTIAVSGGATLRSAGGLTSVAADAGATLIKTTATEFWLAGALA